MYSAPDILTRGECVLWEEERRKRENGRGSGKGKGRSDGGTIAMYSAPDILTRGDGEKREEGGKTVRLPCTP